MRATQTFTGLAAVALVLTFAGCGNDADDDVGSTTDSADQTAPPTDSIAPDDAAPPDVTQTDENDDVSPSSCSDAPEEWREALAEAAPPAPAPGGLAVGVLPTDTDAAIALFDALPDELIGGTRAVSQRLPAVVEVSYETPDRASRDGIQAIDLRDHIMGSVLPEPRADLLAGFFVVSGDDDYTVEAAGHDGDLYWVTYIGTNSGEGIDGVEEVYTITWGEACSPLAFIAGAPTDAGRNELIAAFIEASTDISER